MFHIFFLLSASRRIKWLETITNLFNKNVLCWLFLWFAFKLLNRTNIYNIIYKHPGYINMTQCPSSIRTIHIGTIVSSGPPPPTPTKGYWIKIGPNVSAGCSGKIKSGETPVLGRYLKTLKLKVGVRTAPRKGFRVSYVTHYNLFVQASETGRKWILGELFCPVSRRTEINL